MVFHILFQHLQVRLSFVNFEQLEKTPKQSDSTDEGISMSFNSEHWQNALSLIFSNDEGRTTFFNDLHSPNAETCVSDGHW